MRSFPSAMLIATSHEDAALTNARSESAIALRASGCNAGSFALRQRKTWVSRRSCSALLYEVLQDVGRQRGVEVVGDPDLSFPATRLPGLPCHRQRHEPGLGRTGLGNHDLLAGCS